jgi:hypothetical protein
MKKVQAKKFYFHFSPVYGKKVWYFQKVKNFHYFAVRGRKTKILKKSKTYHFFAIYGSFLQVKNLAI